MWQTSTRWSHLGDTCDDTVILSVGENVKEATENLQGLSDINTWTKHWLIKLNETKSVHVNFTNMKVYYIPVPLNASAISLLKYVFEIRSSDVRYISHVRKAWGTWIEIAVY